MLRLKIGIVTLTATMGILAATTVGALERVQVDVLAVLLNVTQNVQSPAVVVHRGSFMEAAQTARQSQCVKICRVRYRDCQSRKEVPSFDCRGVYQDCIHFTCNSVQG